MRVLILANGDAPSEALVQQLAAEHDLRIAADGAAHRAAALGIVPDIICGDFDSIRLAVAQAEFPLAEFVPTPDQEQADLEKALEIASSRGATAVTIIGALGGRIDHTLGTFAVLLRHHTHLSLIVRDDFTECWAISGTEEAPGRLAFPANPGDTLSLLSLDGAARITLSGVQWPLYDERLEFATRGVSNVTSENLVRVEVRGGAIVVCHLFATQTE